MELINEEAAMFDSLLMDSYVSSTTGVRPLRVTESAWDLLASIEQRLGVSRHLVALPVTMLTVTSVSSHLRNRRKLIILDGNT